MKTSTGKSLSHSLAKLPTGIPGLDEILRGGLPRERNTVVVGGPGCGKTILALQTLVNGAREFNEPGIFIAFEENSKQIIGNAATFGWDLPELQKRKLFFLDARLTPEVIKTGGFDFSALLAIAGAKAKELGAKRIVFDSIDILLALLDDPSAERQELFSLYHWLLESGMTGILTAKDDPLLPVETGYTNHMQFMSDCVIRLDHSLSNRTSLRNLWVMKYRGSSFSENAVPMSIGDNGLELSHSLSAGQQVPASKIRVSSGVARLDTMLGGGYFQGSSILITGAPGTSKSTLSAAFAEAACKRGERALYISFDESASELIRNFSSVGIRLQPQITSGKLRIHSIQADGCSAKQHYETIHGLLKSFKPSSLVIDPLTALIKSGGEEIAQSITERLMRLSKSLGITTVNTSLLNSADEQESTPIQISTIADTWIHLTYQVRAGERNRALTIVKSRGTRHSNQIRELMLSDKGITLDDTYTAGGEVLMGTMRWQKEQAEVADEELAQCEIERNLIELETTTLELESRLKMLQQEIKVKKAEQQLLLGTEQSRKTLSANYLKSLLRKRDFEAAQSDTRKK